MPILLFRQNISGFTTELMALWDGFIRDNNARVMVLAATNRPSDLEEEIIRWFSQAFEIGISSLSDRTKILKVALKS